MSNRRQTRSSLLVQAGDALASMRFGRRRPSIRQPIEQPILAVPHVIDITAPPDEELEERQRLRDAAAQSIGLGPLLEPQQEEDVQQKEEQEQEEVQSPPLPPFPAAYKALQPVSTLAAALPKYYPPPSLRIFALAKQWKPRHLLLSIPFPAHAAAAYLHLFKGAAQDDRELERLEITADSVVFVAESLGSPGFDLAHVVKVGGVDVGAMRRDWNLTDDAGRTVWLLHLASPQEAQRWISAIKSAIFAQRAQRAGLGPARALEGTEPRGDMDVMLSMRLHAAASPPAVSTSTSALAFPNSNSPVSSTSSPGANLSINGNTNGATDTRPPPPPTPTSPTYPASLAPSASERSVRSVQTHPRAASTSEKRKSATASDKHRPSSSEKELGNGKDRDGKRPSSPAVAALKGLFSRPRPRSSSAASVVSAASSSYTHAPHHTHALSSSSSHGFSSSSYGLSSVSSSPATSYRNAPNGVLAGDDTAAKSSSSYGSAEEMVAAMASANGDNSFARMGTLLAASSSSFASSPLQHAPLPSLHSNATSAYHPASTGPPPPLANAKRGLPVGGVVGVSATTSTGLNGVNGGDALGRRIVVPGERERELVEGRRSVDVDADFDASTVDEDVGGTISHPFAQAQTHDPPPKRRFGIRMSQQSQVNGNGHIPHTNGHMSLQPPPRTRMMKRWTGDAGGTLDEEYAGANGSANGYSGDNGNESGYSANGSANGYFGHANGYNGSTSVAGSPSTTGSFYAHPHANGSSGTAGSFGVRERAPSREGSFGRDRAPSVRTAYSAQGSVDGHDHGATYVGPTTPNPDHMSVRSASTSRSRASSVGGASSGNNTASPTNSGKGRRWSTLPRRLTPPASPPPAAPTAARSIPHPYAAGDEPSQHERASSRASGRSFGSTGTGRGSGGGLGTWTRSKRASGVSVGSVGGLSIGSMGGLSAGGTSVGGGSIGSGSVNGSFGPPSTGNNTSPNPRTSHRVSVPPPQRPAPTGALPPAPGGIINGGDGSPSPNGRTFFRESRASSMSVSFRDSPPVVATKSLPAPQTGKSAGHTKAGSSFRESMSMTHRALRLSLMAPKPPPAGVLPPRPDEPRAQPVVQAPVHTHRRSTSAGAPMHNPNGSATGLYVIPASPASPPPRGPLPPTPAVEPTPIRHASLKLKQRLRILSAPPAPHPAQQQENTQNPSMRPTSADGSVQPLGQFGRSRPMTLASFLSASTPSTPTAPAPPPLSAAAFAAALASSPPHYTPPPTPLGEKIISAQDLFSLHASTGANDPSFLQLSAASTPVLRALPALPADPPAPENEYAEIVSLLPPPRRGSRQISIKEVERTPTPDLEAPSLPRDQEAENAGPGPGKLFSLSRHGSVISLGIVTM